MITEGGSAKPKPQNEEEIEVAPKAERPKSKIAIFLSHPVVSILTIISAIAGLIGLPISIYLYYAAKEYPQLIYYVHPVKATIVHTGEASRLAATFDNKTVETDITAAQIAIWNQGRRAIKRDGVLKPIVISTENNTPILEATIRKSSRDVTQLALNTDELQNGRVTVAWNILEQNDGGVVQLIYAGNDNLQIKVDGVVEGQSQLERLEFTGKIKSPSEQYESERWGDRYLGYLLTALGGLFIWAAFGIRKSKANYKYAFDISLKSHKRLIKVYDSGINTSLEDIEKYDKEITQVEAEIEKYKEKDGYEKIVEGDNGTIEMYKRFQAMNRGQIEKYESAKEKALAEEVNMIQESRKEERRFNLGVIVAALLALSALAPAFYFLLIAKPIGPPFGF